VGVKEEAFGSEEVKDLSKKKSTRVHVFKGF